jgi:hypothetical protein
MKATITLVLVAIAAFLYFRPASEKAAPPPKVRVSEAATAPRSTVAVAPAPSSRTVDRLKTGPNAQTDLAPKIDRLKTGPNAQNEWKPNSGALKTGPNAQTPLTPNIDRLKTSPNAQNEWKPNSGGLKTGPNAQTDLTLKRSW